MTIIKPIKSIRQQQQDSEQQKTKGQRHLELAKICMTKAIDKNMDPLLIQRAMDLYSQVMDENPEKPQAYLAMAYLSWKLDETETARQFLNHVLAIHPHQVEANSMLDAIEKGLSH